jgi:hypothetical protein
MNMNYQTGIYTSDGRTYDALQKDLIAERVWFKTISYVEFMDAVVMEDTDALDKVLKFPKDYTLPTFEITEGSTGEYQKLGYFNMYFTMNKYRSKLMIDDESKVRNDEPTQWNYAIDAVARGMAIARDNEILTALWNGVGTEKTATVKWNNDAADVLGDIANLVEEMFDKADTNVTEDELKHMVVYYPLKLIGRLKLPEMFRDHGTSGGNMGRMRVEAADSWVTQKLGFTFKGSRKLNDQNSALCVIPGPQTAIHYSYTGGKIPTVAYVRDEDEGSDSYLVTQYYKTSVRPQNFTRQTTNDRILRINTVSD